MTQTTKRQLVPIEEWKGDVVPGRSSQLIPGSDETAYDASVAQLREGGCGAWRGRTVCGDPATWLAIGGLGLYFLTFRTCHSPSTPFMAVLCERHAGTLAIVSRDMPRVLRREHEAKLRKALYQRGASDLLEEARMVVLTRLDEEAA